MEYVLASMVANEWPTPGVLTVLPEMPKLIIARRRMSLPLLSGLQKLFSRSIQPPANLAASAEDWTGVTARDRAILEQISEFTLTSRARQLALIDAVRYVVQREVPGSFVECGVWRGGSSMAIALTLMDLGVNDRDIYLFDTFSGMTPPSDRDRTIDNQSAADLLSNQETREGVICRAGQDDVQANMLRTGYPSDRIHLVVGPVEATLPDPRITSVGLLRLDTDWYESTKCELEHLYPKLSPLGVMIVDDYGHWRGAREACDEYFAGQPAQLMQRIDYTGRLLIKC
jgi:O-methyltransferase